MPRIPGPGQVRQLQPNAQMKRHAIFFTDSFLAGEEARLGLREYAGPISQFLQQPVMRTGEEVAHRTSR